MIRKTTPRALTVSERVRQPTEIRRSLIVDAARFLIADQGLARTTLRDIAKASDVSVGTVTYHFAGMDDVLAEVLRSEMELFYQPLATAARAAARAGDGLRIHIDGFFGEDTRSIQHGRLWLDFFALAVRDPSHARWQAASYAIWREDIRAVLARGVADGEFRIDDLDTMATDFMIAFDGLAMQAYLPGSELGPLGAGQYLHRWVARHIPAGPGGNGQG